MAKTKQEEWGELELDDMLDALLEASEEEIDERDPEEIDIRRSGEKK